MVFVNGRFRAHRMTGMQRYAAELVARFGSGLEVITPWQPLKGVRGHLWEQSVLPARARGQLLWSPCNTGPVMSGRQVVTIHDISAIDHPEWYSPRFAALHKWLLPRLLRRVEKIIAVSHYTRQRLIARFGVHPDHVAVIPNGVGPEYFPRTEAEVGRVRRSLHLPEGRYVLSVCSLEPRKNLARLLEAWRKVRADRELTLVVAGARGASNVFRDAGIDRVSDAIHFAGYVPEEDLPALYSGAACFVYPSLYEGFGLPVLEALACGTAAVTSATTSLPEVAGAGSLLVDPESVDEIASSMASLMDAPERAKAMGEQGRAHAEKFSWDACAAETWRLLSSLS